MRKFIIAGLAAFAMAAVPAAIGGAVPAHAGTTKCRTSYFPGGSETTCDVFTDDGRWYVTTTYCNLNGNCTTR
jgi:hypothetical protein